MDSGIPEIIVDQAPRDAVVAEVKLFPRLLVGAHGALAVTAGAGAWVAMHWFEAPPEISAQSFIALGATATYGLAACLVRLSMCSVPDQAYTADAYVPAPRSTKSRVVNGVHHFGGAPKL